MEPLVEQQVIEGNHADQPLSFHQRDSPDVPLLHKSNRIALGVRRRERGDGRCHDLGLRVESPAHHTNSEVSIPELRATKRGLRYHLRDIARLLSDQTAATALPLLLRFLTGAMRLRCNLRRTTRSTPAIAPLTTAWREDPRFS